MIKKTQYERALEDLKIGIIHARSPQAKGRVERLFGTLQDRLVKELRLRRITDINFANEFIKREYIDVYNKKYSIVPAKNGNLHRKTCKKELYSVFCIRQERILTNDYTIRCNNRSFQLKKQQITIIRPKNRIRVHEYLDGEKKLFIRKTELFYSEITGAVLKTTKKERVKCYENVKAWIPKKDHPWRKTNSMFFK